MAQLNENRDNEKEPAQERELKEHFSQMSKEERERFVAEVKAAGAWPKS